MCKVYYQDCNYVIRPANLCTSFITLYEKAGFMERKLFSIHQSQLSSDTAAHTRIIRYKNFGTVFILSAYTDFENTILYPTCSKRVTDTILYRKYRGDVQRLELQYLGKPMRYQLSYNLIDHKAEYPDIGLDYPTVTKELTITEDGGKKVLPKVPNDINRKIISLLQKLPSEPELKLYDGFNHHFSVEVNASGRWLYNEEVDSVINIPDPLRRLLYYLIRDTRQGRAWNAVEWENKKYGKIVRAGK